MRLGKWCCVDDSPQPGYHLYGLMLAVTTLQASSVKTCQNSMRLASRRGQDRGYNSRVTLREIRTDWVTERWTIEGRFACLYSSLNVQSSHSKVSWAQNAGLEARVVTQV